MTAIAAPARTLARRPFMLATVCATVAALLATATLAWLGRDDEASPRTLAIGAGAFQLAQPTGWDAATPRQLHALDGRPDALLRRADGRGVVVVHEQPRLDGSLAAVERDLERRLGRELPDAKHVASRTVRLTTGPALSYTFVRERAGLVHGIVVAPAGARTLTFETAARGDAADVAREIGAIVRSLRPAA